MMKPHEVFLMNFLTDGGQEQGIAYLQALVVWLDHEIRCERYEQTIEKGIHFNRAASSYARRSRSMALSLERNIEGLTEQYSRATRKDAVELSNKLSLADLVKQRNRHAEILSAYAEVPGELKNYLVVK
jgi:hypothetical protein